MGLGITNCDLSFLYILAVSTEKVQHGALEEFSKENLTKEETSQSKAVEQMESESTEGSKLCLPILFCNLSPVFCHVLND